MNLYKTTIATDGYGQHGFHTEAMNLPVAACRAEVRADAYIRKTYASTAGRALRHVVSTCVLVEEDWK